MQKSSMRRALSPFLTLAALSVLSVVTLAAAMGCGSVASTPDAGAYVWRLPQGFPVPKVPADNPMSDAKVELGRRLFYDPRVSWPQSRACSTCHVQAVGFTTPTSKGTGLHAPTKRNVMALAVPAYMSAYLWADSTCTSIEAVISQTLLDENEFGGAGREADIVKRLGADATYARLFEEAFPGKPISFDAITKATASFVRTIASGDSPYDRYQRGDPAAMSPAARRGMDLFFSETTECYHCHLGFTFSDSVTHSRLAVSSMNFSNTGLYDVDGAGAYPVEDQGLLEVTGDPADMGRFKAPTLRNIAKTAPYMHDGSMNTLREVVDAYVAGGRSALDGGVSSPRCDPLILGRASFGPLSEQETTDLIAFLESLTDEAFLSDPRFSSPFE